MVTEARDERRDVDSSEYVLYSESRAALVAIAPSPVPRFGYSAYHSEVSLSVSFSWSTGTRKPSWKTSSGRGMMLLKAGSQDGRVSRVFSTSSRV